MTVGRRAVLVRALLAAGVVSAVPMAALAATSVSVGNVSGLHAVRVARVVAPSTLAEVRAAVLAWPGQIAVGGGRYSMGGQIGIDGGLHIDMRNLNGLVWLRPPEMVVRVQAGMRWRDLQDHLDAVDLSVRTMQSYANFTVGGSVSVNAHGRYVGHGPVSGSVRALQLVLASGEVVEASHLQNAALFHAAIGGYGALGVITEVELSVDRNGRIERRTASVGLADYPGYFARKVRDSAGCLMHNADLLPPLFDQALVVNWSHTDKALTVADRLVPRGQPYALEQTLIWAMTELPMGDVLHRKVVRPQVMRKPEVVWRNYEASLDAAALEPRSRTASTYALQEYFVPVAGFGAFAIEMARIIRRHDARVLNVSIRHSPADTDSVMAWAREEVFSFVLYYKQDTHGDGSRSVGVWTRELIAAALDQRGTYYLPYQRHATQGQFDAAYPGKGQFKSTKAVFDPSGRMTNELWRQYL